MRDTPTAHGTDGVKADGTVSDALVARMGLGLVVWRLEDAADPASITLVAANPAAPALAKFDFGSVFGRTIGDLFPAAISLGRHQLYADVALSGIERPLDAAAYPEFGQGIVFGRIVPLPNNCVGVVFGSASDQRGPEDETLKLNAFLDSIVDNIPAMVFVKDAEHLRYERVNRVAESLTGYDRKYLYGKDDHQLHPKEQANFFQAKDRDVLRGGRMLDIPEEPLDTPGGRRWLHTKKIPILGPDGTPRHLLGISLDITERKLAVEALRKAHEELEIRVQERTSDLVMANAQLKREIDDRQRTQEALAHAEDQLRHSQKMEAVGRLAGGIAHDFNNLLSVIISYATILATEVDRGSELAQGLDEVRRAGERAGDLTR